MTKYVKPLIETPNGVKIDESFLPDSVLVQPDLSQNDPTTPDYVKNRTHWTGESRKPLVAENKTVTRRNSGKFGTSILHSFKEGDHFLAIIGDKVYDGHCKVAAATTSANISVDYGVFIVYEGGELLIGKTNSALNVFYYVYPTVDETTTFSYYHCQEEVHPLDERYLPDTIARKSDIPNLDVTAEVGQTIIVKEVDENGKPTKWESADYQPRTHWSEDVVILDETTITPDAEGILIFSPLAVPNIGDICKVKYNGVEYECEAVDGTALAGVTCVILGNLSLGMGTGDTGEPFMLVITVAGDNGGELAPMDGSASVVLSIKGTVTTKLPVKFIPDEVVPYYVQCVQGENVTQQIPRITVSALESLIDAGRTVIVKVSPEHLGTYYMYLSVDQIIDGKRVFGFNNGQYLLGLMPQDDGTYIGEITPNT